MLLLLGIVGCGRPEASTPESKDLFSVWKDSTGHVFDLTNYTFSTQDIFIPQSSTSGCQCSLDLSGTQASGEAYRHGCTHYGPDTNYCPVGATAYTYTNVGAELTLCELGASCTVYH